MNPLAKFLLAALDGSSSEHTEDSRDSPATSVSRRGFMTSAVAAGIATAGTGLIAVASGVGLPTISRRGRVVEVALGHRHWTVDPTPFGPGAEADFEAQLEGWRVWLRGARLPGTDVWVDFSALVERRVGGYIGLAMPRMGFAARASLEDWVIRRKPISGDCRPGTYHVGLAALTVSDRVVLEVSPDSGWKISTPEQLRLVNLRLKGRVRVWAESVTLTLNPNSDSGLAWKVLRRRPAHSTFFALESPVIQKPARHPVPRSDTTLAAFHHLAIDAVAGQAFELERRNAAIFLVEGAGRLARRGAGGISLLHLERTAFTFSSGAGAARCGLAGTISQRPHSINLGEIQATLFGSEAKPFFAVLHERDGTGDVEAPVQLRSLRLSVSDADYAVVEAQDRPVTIRFTDNELNESAPERRGDQIAANGLQALVVLQLENSAIGIRRGLDLVNLAFGFKGFDLKVSGGEGRIERRHAPGHSKSWPAAQITVGFPPQHIAEEWVSENDLPSIFNYALPTMSRLSGPSRIVFALDPDGTTSPLWKRVPLTLEALTNWSGLRLAAMRRAPAPDIPFDIATHDRTDCQRSPATQMDIVRIGINDSYSQAMAKIGATLTAPTPDETALEMAGRLIFSPSREAGRRGKMTNGSPVTEAYYSGWDTPRSPPDYRRAPLWSARLDAHGRKTVRAVWSRMLSPGIYPPTVPCIPNDARDRSMLVLDPQEHWEIVAQTSIFGMPALRRLKSPDDSDPVDQALKDLPSGEVIAAPDYTYLRGLAPNPEDAGVAQPTPFQDADIILTSLGGNFVGDWRGEPPSLLFQQTPLMRLRRMLGGQASSTPTLNVERFDYRSQLGRDVRIQVVLKGFFFPLGIRAAWVIMTERQIVITKAGGPTSIPVQRNFLIVQNPIKHWPAIYQPFDGREFPATELDFKTLQTPDILDPKAGTNPGGAGPGNVVVDSNGRLLFGNDTSAGPFVFWPKWALPPPGTPAGNDILFTWKLDDNPTPIVSRLIFVENGAAADPDKMAQLADYYRGIDPTDPARRADFAGSRQRYAPADASGKEVAFDTDSWVLGVQGRQNPAGGTGQPAEIFDLDARMNGADQPPFYPRIHRAYIKLQTLDRLLGRNLGVAEVAYNGVYKSVGFDSPLNRAEIYLQVYSPNIDFDPKVSGLKGSTGSVSNPSARLAAFSRRLGLIGGTGDAGAKAPRPLMQGSLSGLNRSRRRRPLAIPQDPDDPTPFDFSKALDKSTFDPSQFFGQLSSAKLLGILSLSDIVKAVAIDAAGAAPSIVETLQYAAGAAGGSIVDVLKTVAAKLGDPLAQALAYLADAVSKFDNGSTPVKFAQLYPELSSRFLTAQSALGGTLDALKPPDPDAGSVITSVTQTAAALKALMAEAQRVLANPTPPLIDDDITALVVDWNNLKAVFQGQFIPYNVLTSIQGTISNLFFDLASTGLSSVLVGFDGTTWSATDWLAAVQDPSAWADQVTDSLFADVFGDAISDFLTYVVGATEEFSADIVLAEGAFLSAAQPVISDAIDAVAGQLQAPALWSDPNIENAGPQDALIRSIRNGIQAKLDAAALASPPPVTLAALELRIDAVVGVISPATLQGIIALAIDSMKAYFILPGGGDPSPVMAAVEAAVSDKLTAIAAAQVGATAGSLKGDLARLGVAPKAAILRLIELLSRISLAMGSAAQIAAMSAIGQTAAGWCSTVVGQGRAAVDLADDYASGLLADGATLAGALSTVLNAVQAVAPPVGATPGVIAAYASARGRLLAAVQHLAAIQQAIETDRGILHAVRTALQTDVCSNPGDFLGPAGSLISYRHDAVKALSDIAQHIAEIAALAGGDTATAPLIVLVAPLFGQVTSIAAVAASSATWAAIQGDLSLIGSVIGGDYQASLNNAQSQLTQAATHAVQVAAVSPPVLSDIAVAASAYVQDIERPLLGLALQTVAFGDDAVRKVAIAASAILGGAAHFVETLHKTVGDLLRDVVKVLNQPTIQLIVNPAVVAQFNAALTAIAADDATLVSLATSADAVKVAAQPGGLPLPALAAKLSDLVTKAANLADAWGTQPPAIISAIQAVANVADEIMRGDLSALLNLPDLHMILEQIEEQAQALIASLVPTSAHLTYDWSTPLQTFDVGGVPLFYMQTAGDGLTLSVIVDVDFAADTRTGTVNGTIDPFAIKLFGAADIATIKFDGASFRSVNGQTPTFNAKVSGVELGAEMDFIEALEEYFSPGGGEHGFYIQPTLSPPGIEAGYIFAAPFIDVGELEFINIALKVCARLPFDGSAAEFEFDFASAELPFLIAAPPYGGGGYLQLIATAKGIQRFTIEFVFGGVAAIKFGPLSAQGRLVAGVAVFQNVDHQNITAIIEAVGEGSIACFGICVAITVTATQSGSSLQGSSDYSFSFSVGWITFSYGFRAGYTVKGGTSDSAQTIVRSGESQAQTYKRYRTLVPLKMRQWDLYKTRVSMELLNA